MINCEDLSEKKEKVDLQTVTWIGRTMPPHFGHLYYLQTLCDKFDKVVIVIGSCFEHGNVRYSISAHLREKMLRAMLEESGISKSKYTFEYLPDFEDNNVWYKNFMKINEKHNSKCIATGNEWIYQIVKENGNKIEVKDFELKHPFKYRATDVRNAIINNDFELLKNMVPFSVLQILLTNDCFKSVLYSNQNQAVHFVPGRQTADIVLLLKDIKTQKLYVLLGKRAGNKKDFPNILALPGGAIEEFESPTDSVIRILKDETGLEFKVLDKTFLHPPVKFKNIDTSLTTMKMVGIYSSEDVMKAGTKGGSSQCFTIFVEDNVEKFKEKLVEGEELSEVDFYEVESIKSKSLAFQHSEMLDKAMYISKAMPKIEMDKIANLRNSTNIVVISESKTAKSTAAYGIMYEFNKLLLSVELASNFDKEEKYENRLQERKAGRYIGKVDYIVTDLPLSMCINSKDFKLLNEVNFDIFDKIENYIIYVKSDKTYKTAFLGESFKNVSDTLEASLVARGYKLNYANNVDEALILALKFAYRNETNNEVKNKIEKAISLLEFKMQME